MVVVNVASSVLDPIHQPCPVWYNHYTARTCEGLVVCGQLPEQYAVRVHVTSAAAAPMHQQLRRHVRWRAARLCHVRGARIKHGAEAKV
jgi:hypothetical protein